MASEDLQLYRDEVKHLLYDFSIRFAIIDCLDNFMFNADLPRMVTWHLVDKPTRGQSTRGQVKDSFPHMTKTYIGTTTGEGLGEHVPPNVWTWGARPPDP